MFYFCEAPRTLLPWPFSTLDHSKLLLQYVEQYLHHVCYKHSQILLYVCSFLVGLLPFEVWSEMAKRQAQKIQRLDQLQIPKTICRVRQARVTRRDLLWPKGVTYWRMAAQKIPQLCQSPRPAHDGAMMSGPP